MRPRARSPALLPRMRAAHDRECDSHRMDGALPRLRSPGAPLIAAPTRQHAKRANTPSAPSAPARQACQHAKRATRQARQAAPSRSQRFVAILLRIRFSIRSQTRFPIRFPGRFGRSDNGRRSPRGRWRGRARPPVRAFEGQHRVGITRDGPAQLVHGSMVPVAQRDQIVQVRQAPIGPVLDVMDVRELRVGAAREAAALVTPVDLHPLHRGRIPPGSPLAQDRTLRILHGQVDVSVAGQPSHHFGPNGSDAGDLGHGIIGAADQQLERRMHDDSWPRRRTRSPTTVLSRRRSTPLAEVTHQLVIEPLVVGHVPDRI